MLPQVLGRNIDDGFESIGICWLSNKIFLMTDIINAALWGLWKNDTCFRNASWHNVLELLMKVVVLAQIWRIMCPEIRTDVLKN